jgi:hypothetical protein
MIQALNKTSEKIIFFSGWGRLLILFVTLIPIFTTLADDCNTIAYYIRLKRQALSGLADDGAGWRSCIDYDTPFVRVHTFREGQFERLMNGKLIRSQIADFFIMHASGTTDEWYSEFKKIKREGSGCLGIVRGVTGHEVLRERFWEQGADGIWRRKSDFGTTGGTGDVAFPLSAWGPADTGYTDFGRCPQAALIVFKPTIRPKLGYGNPSTAETEMLLPLYINPEYVEKVIFADGRVFTPPKTPSTPENRVVGFGRAPSDEVTEGRRCPPPSPCTPRQRPSAPAALAASARNAFGPNFINYMTNYALSAAGLNPKWAEGAGILAELTLEAHQSGQLQPFIPFIPAAVAAFKSEGIALAATSTQALSAVTSWGLSSAKSATASATTLATQAGRTAITAVGGAVSGTAVAAASAAGVVVGVGMIGYTEYTWYGIDDEKKKYLIEIGDSWWSQCKKGHLFPELGGDKFLCSQAVQKKIDQEAKRYDQDLLAGNECPWYALWCRS